MDIQTIDNQYNQLQTQAQQTIGEIQTLAQKLQSAAQAGNQDAREWFLDLKSIAIAIQAEQNQVANLLGALHNFAAAQVPQSVPAYPQQQPYYPPQQQQPYYPPQGGGGLLGQIFNSGFGRAMVTGAGFGIGDDLINKIF